MTFSNRLHCPMILVSLLKGSIMKKLFAIIAIVLGIGANALQAETMICKELASENVKTGEVRANEYGGFIRITKLNGRVYFQRYFSETLPIGGTYIAKLVETRKDGKIYATPNQRQMIVIPNKDEVLFALSGDWQTTYINCKIIK